MDNFYSIVVRDENLKVLFIEKVDSWWEIRFTLVQFIGILIPICQQIITPNISKTAVVEERIHIKHPVFIGNKTNIKSGSYLEGPLLIGDNCDIGPNCYIRQGVIIGNNCRIGASVELKESILLQNVSIAHFSYIGNSIIGKDVNIAAGVITAVRRFDNANIVIKIGNHILDTGLKKFGTLIGNKAMLGIGVHILPGRTIAPNSVVYPNTLVRHNID